MASSQPIIRQISWISLVIQLILIGIIIFVFSLIKASNPFFVGYMTYVVISILVKIIIPKYHRQGIKYYKKSQYEKAIPEFEKSYNFFQKYSWIDKYNSIVLLSACRISYLEMALLNMAFCYGQLGDGVKSKELYNKTLLEFPNSKIAISALKMLNASKDTE